MSVPDNEPDDDPSIEDIMIFGHLKLRRDARALEVWDDYSKTCRDSTFPPDTKIFFRDLLVLVRKVREGPDREWEVRQKLTAERNAAERAEREALAVQDKERRAAIVRARQEQTASRLEAERLEGEERERRNLETAAKREREAQAERDKKEKAQHALEMARAVTRAAEGARERAKLEQQQQKKQQAEDEAAVRIRLQILQQQQEERDRQQQQQQQEEEDEEQEQEEEEEKVEEQEVEEEGLYQQQHPPPEDAEEEEEEEEEEDEEEQARLQQLEVARLDQFSREREAQEAWLAAEQAREDAENLGQTEEELRTIASALDEQEMKTLAEFARSEKEAKAKAAQERRERIAREEREAQLAKEKEARIRLENAVRKEKERVEKEKADRAAKCKAEEDAKLKSQQEQEFLVETARAAAEEKAELKSAQKKSDGSDRYEKYRGESLKKFKKSTRSIETTLAKKGKRTYEGIVVELLESNNKKKTLVEHGKGKMKIFDASGTLTVSIEGEFDLGIPKSAKPIIVDVGKSCTFTGEWGDVSEFRKLINGESVQISGTGTLHYTGINHTYNGTFVNSLLNGTGQFTDKTSDKRYQGGFSRGKFSGSGQLQIEEKLKYVGWFKDSAFNGFGILTFLDDNTRIECDWAMGEPERDSEVKVVLPGGIECSAELEKLKIMFFLPPIGVKFVYTNPKTGMHQSKELVLSDRPRIDRQNKTALTIETIVVSLVVISAVSIVIIIWEKRIGL